MKLLHALLATGAILSATSASALTCVGGPRFAFYAYTNVAAAQICAQNVARVSRDCAAAVRVGPCFVQNFGSINATPPAYCTCPGQFAVGTWPNAFDAADLEEDNSAE